MQAILFVSRTVFGDLDGVPHVFAHSDPADPEVVAVREVHDVHAFIRSIVLLWCTRGHETPGGRVYEYQEPIPRRCFAESIRSEYGVRAAKSWMGHELLPEHAGTYVQIVSPI